MSIEELISWLVFHVDIEINLIKDENGKVVASFQPLSLDIYYKLPKLEVNMSEEWENMFTTHKYYYGILKSW